MNQRELLRRAMDSESVPRDLRARVQGHLEERRWGIAPLLAGALACLGFLFAMTRVYDAAMLRVGLIDHVHCGLGNNYPKQNSQAEMAQAVGTEFAPILGPLAQKSGGLKLISAHRCSAGHRDYVHFIFAGPDGLTSVSLTKKQGAEWLPTQLRRKLDEISVTGFEEEDYLVFVSSAAPKEELTAALPELLTLRI